MTTPAALARTHTRAAACQTVNLCVPIPLRAAHGSNARPTAGDHNDLSLLSVFSVFGLQGIRDLAMDLLGKLRWQCVCQGRVAPVGTHVEDLREVIGS